jgi:hypothetical protein
MLDVVLAAYRQRKLSQEEAIALLAGDRAPLG